MPRKIYVIGHKNPDTDSIVSAIAYAELLRRQGLDNVVAARQGDLWPETQYILERFGIPFPSLVEDVRPSARDLMATHPIVGKPDESVHAIGQRLRQHSIRAMPVVGEDGRLVGLISVEDFANILLLGLDPDLIDQIHLEVDNVVETLDGRLLVEIQGRKLRDKVLVAAMDLETVRDRLEPDIMVVMGDREDVQRVAIEQQVGAVVITGGLSVSDEIIALAREKNVTLISSPHHTFTTVRLLNLSIPIWHIMQRQVLAASLDEPLDDVRDKLSRQRTLPILDNSSRVVGVVSRSDVINPVRHGLYLVDHNERSQTVDGLDEAELLGIVDHHRIADIQTGAPIFFRNEIVGSTSTLIAGLFGEGNIPIRPAIAGILLGGIITDTVLLRSPTSTPRDQRVAEELAAIAGVDMAGFGHQIFARVSDLTSRTPRQILTTDFKEYRIDDQPFAISYMETVQKRQVDQVRDDLLAGMQALRAEKGYASLLLIIVDIVHNQTEILIDGMENEIAEALGEPLISPHSVTMSGVVSRKKQIVPILPRVAQVRRKNGR
ncbi:MAG: putative manganese-dependent inorganic diphosphatase [Anaerolineae bacterium]|nr:putative manganese-dependent inorganic diphosphatase [Anaerolineae bacterium]